MFFLMPMYIILLTIQAFIIFYFLYKYIYINNVNYHAHTSSLKLYHSKNMCTSLGNQYSDNIVIYIKKKTRLIICIIDKYYETVYLTRYTLVVTLN